MPLETAAAYGAPTASANASSKRSIVGPSDSRPDRSTSTTSSSSRSSSHGLESATCLSADTQASAGERDISTTSSQSLQRSSAPVDRVEVRLLQLERHRADADLPVVDRPHRRDLRRRPDHEDLVREVEVGADEQRLLDGVAELVCAIWMIVSRVIPGRIDIESGGVSRRRP